MNFIINLTGLNIIIFIYLIAFKWDISSLSVSFSSYSQEHTFHWLCNWVYEDPPGDILVWHLSAAQHWSLCGSKAMNI